MNPTEWLKKPVLNRRDIMEIENCSCSKANRIISDCKTLFKGAIPCRATAITTQSYLKYCGYEEDWATLVGKVFNNNG